MSLSNELWSLLDTEQPDEDAIMACINDYPYYCSLVIDNELPIHCAIKYRLSMDVIRKMILSYLECCMIVYEEYLLLHHLLNPITLSRYDHIEYIIADDIIMSAIDIYPDAVRMGNESGDPPLVIECEHACRYDIIIKLASIYPDALTKSYGPYHQPLHRVLYNDRSTTEIISYLIDQYPDAVLTVCFGSLPIHIECQFYCRHDVVKKLLETYPESIDIVDDGGSYPLHYACVNGNCETVFLLISLSQNVVCAKDSRHNYPLHIECSEQCRYDVILKLLEIFPDAVTMYGSAYVLPLHLAISSDCCDALKIIPKLIESFPNAVRHLSRDYRYPFMEMFSQYCNAYVEVEDVVTLQCKRHMMTIKAISLDMLNLYLIALCDSDYDQSLRDIQRNPVYYRLLLNLATHHLSPKHIHDYHDMNYHARSPLLHLFLQLSASRMLYKLKRGDIANDVCFIDIEPQSLEVVKMKYLWLWHMMILAGCKDNEENDVDDHDSHMHFFYGWINGDDLGQHLLRYMVGYL